MVLKGHCLCKAVTYTVDVDQPLITGYDHCDDCQRQSGSTYCKLRLQLHTECLRRFWKSLTSQGLARESLRVLVVVIAGRESVGPAPASLDNTDGAKLLHDPCPQAGAPPKGYTDPQRSPP